MDVTSSLFLKANASDVATSLTSKASTTDLASGLATKVDKVTGKELSANDYSTLEKDKLASITGINTGDQDLSSFATTTNLNLKANITDVNTSLALKANALDVTSSLSLKANASEVATSLTSKASSTDLASGLATKVDKVTGKELSTNDYSTLEKDKLAAIAGTNTGDQDLSSFATNSSLDLKANLVSPTLVTPMLGDATATTVNASGDISAKRFTQLRTDSISSTTTTSIDARTGNVFHVYLANTITTLNFNNSAIGTYLIKFRQINSGTAKTVKFPSAWLWSGGVEPVITAINNRVDVITLIYDGYNYYAAIVQNFY